MHYYIDGYNLLFRFADKDENLQKAREAIIRDLNQKISLLKLNVSIVFDSAFQWEEHTRSHFDAIEIHYTRMGKSADEYILDQLQNSSSPQKETVITSDKVLARLARNLSARTESVEGFVQRLNKSYMNKLRALENGIPTARIKKPPINIKEPEISTHPKGAPLEAYHDYYAKIFETEWQAIQAQEQEKKKRASLFQQKRTPRKPRKKIDPFAQESPEEPQEATEMKRWLKLFEKKR